MLQILNCHLLTLCYFFQFDPTKMDRVELAFRKFDLNQDGYLSREEFDQVRFQNKAGRTDCLMPFQKAQGRAVWQNFPVYVKGCVLLNTNFPL